MIIWFDLLFYSFICSANTIVADSPYFIPQDKADQVLAAANDGGVAEPVPDTSIHFFHPKNLYSKL